MSVTLTPQSSDASALVARCFTRGLAPREFGVDAVERFTRGEVQEGVRVQLRLLGPRASPELLAELLGGRLHFRPAVPPAELRDVDIDRRAPHRVGEDRFGQPTLGCFEVGGERLGVVRGELRSVVRLDARGPFPRGLLARR